MSHRHLFILLLLTLSTSLTNQQLRSLPLKPPNPSGRFQLDNSPVETNEKNVALNAARGIDAVYPCNGTFVKTNGTTCGLKEIVLGRCFNYQYVRRGLYLSNTTEVKNCTELYDLFESEVRYKPHCNANMSTYAKYFQTALAGVHVINRAIFWSGTYAIAHAYSGNGANYITLEDTLAANLLDGLTWCGKANDTEGFDYVSCPNNCQDNRWADLAFWGLASRTFAERVAGQIYVVLNGSRTDGRPSYRNNSFFAEFELPYFQRTGPYRVTNIHVLVLHTPDLPVKEKCGQKSVLILENLIRGAQFEYSCTDDPDELIMLMCADSWSARECQISREVLRYEWNRKLHGTANTPFHLSSVLALFCIGVFGQILSIVE